MDFTRLPIVYEFFELCVTYSFGDLCIGVFSRSNQMLCVRDGRNCPSVGMVGSVVDPDRIRIQWGPWIRIRIRIQLGKNDPQIEVLDVLF
jgi:hypothetical protein